MVVQLRGTNQGFSREILEVLLGSTDVVVFTLTLALSHRGFFAQLDVGAVARPNRPRVPVCPTPWMPAYAGMTVVVQSTHRGRGGLGGVDIHFMRVIKTQWRVISGQSFGNY